MFTSENSWEKFLRGEINPETTSIARGDAPTTAATEAAKVPATEFPVDSQSSTAAEYEGETFTLTFEGKTYQIPADYDSDTSVFLLPDGRVLTYDSIRGDVPLEDDLQVANFMSDIIFRAARESLAGLSKEELRQKLAAVGRTLVEAK